MMKKYWCVLLFLSTPLVCMEKFKKRKDEEEKKLTHSPRESNLKRPSGALSLSRKFSLPLIEFHNKESLPFSTAQTKNDFREFLMLACKFTPKNHKDRKVFCGLLAYLKSKYLQFEAFDADEDEQIAPEAVRELQDKIYGIMSNQCYKSGLHYKKKAEKKAQNPTDTKQLRKASAAAKKAFDNFEQASHLDNDNTNARLEKLQIMQLQKELKKKITFAPSYQKSLPIVKDAFKKQREARTKFAKVKSAIELPCSTTNPDQEKRSVSKKRKSKKKEAKDSTQLLSESQKLVLNQQKQMNPKCIKKLNTIENLLIESTTIYLKAFNNEQDKFLLEQAQKNMDSIGQAENMKCMLQRPEEFEPRSEITKLQKEIDSYLLPLKKEEEKSSTSDSDEKEKY